jgi:hypothetical protein
MPQPGPHITRFLRLRTKKRMFRCFRCQQCELVFCDVSCSLSQCIPVQSGRAWEGCADSSEVRNRVDTSRTPSRRKRTIYGVHTSGFFFAYEGIALGGRYALEIGQGGLASNRPEAAAARGGKATQT